MSKNAKAVFLDRDGVINKAIFRDGKATSPRSLEEWEWLDGIHDAVKQLKEAGFLILVVTNQPDIFRGIYPQEAMEQFHKMVKDELHVDDLMACMHDNEHNCHCRKPKPGMLLDLSEKWNVSIENSVFIGDTFKDIEAGKRAECFTILLDKDYNQDTDSDYRAIDLNDAVVFIIKRSEL